MRHTVSWRWVLPFAQVCLMLICVQWMVDQRFPPHPETFKEIPGGVEVGWDPRSCWDCDSVGLLPQFLFLGIMGAFYSIGGQLDRGENSLRRVPPLFVAGVSVVSVAAYGFGTAIFNFVLLVVAAAVLLASVQIGRKVAHACGSSARIRLTIYASAAFCSIGAIVYLGMSPHCGASCLVIDSCLLMFGLFAAGKARSETTKPRSSVGFLIMTIAICVTTECALVFWIGHRYS